MRCVRSVALVVVSHGAAGQDSPCLLGCLCHPGEEILPLAEVSLHHQAHVLLVYALTLLAVRFALLANPQRLKDSSLPGLRLKNVLNQVLILNLPCCAHFGAACETNTLFTK